MNKFLDQFNLTPYQRMDMENFIFTQADKMVEGYRGGTWETTKVGDVTILVIPGDGDITLNNYAFGGSMTADATTAGAAFSSIVSNWYAGLRYEQGKATDAMLEAVSDYGYNLKCQCEKLPNASKFLRFID